jgi:RND family efflux transporter MFP subunit
MNNVIRTLIKVVLPLVVIAGAVAVAVGMVKNRPEAPKRETPERTLLVEVQPVKRIQQRIDVRAQGTVRAARQINIQPQVAGQVTSVHEQLIPGGFIEKGDLIARVDTTDYRLTVEQQKLNVENARALLDQEKGRQVIAAREWELFQKNSDNNKRDPSLALRKPQLRQAEVSIELAEAQLKQAKVNLGRTAIRAPFNAIVQTENIEKGQLVNAQTVIATLVGTDSYWVRASVPLEEIGRISIPGVNAKEGEGSTVTIEQDLGAGAVKYEGKVIRLLSELDQVGRMAQLIIEVADPLGLERPKEQAKLPLLIGAYVTVVFEGSQQRALIEVPRQAIHNGDEVWVMTPENTLAVREVSVVSGRPDTVLVNEGLEDGERVIVSQIGAPVEGMKLKLEGSKKPEMAEKAEVKQ